MFEELRRKDRMLDQEQITAILKKEKYGVLSLCGEDGYPYGVPLHYVMVDGSVYIHGSVEKGIK